MVVAAHERGTLVILQCALLIVSHDGLQHRKHALHAGGRWLVQHHVGGAEKPVWHLELGGTPPLLNVSVSVDLLLDDERLVLLQLLAQIRDDGRVAA